MEKLIFCVRCKFLVSKIGPRAEDMLTAQKSLANYPQLFQNKDEVLLFNQWECKCGSKIITVGIE